MRVEAVPGQLRHAEGLATLHARFNGDVEGVREGLGMLFDCPMLSRLTLESRGTVEIVLAEALNNIAEHAYSTYSGEVEVSLTAHDGFLLVRMEDRGLPMPQEDLPDGKMVPVENVPELPEGGFGWFLIRTLTQELIYARRDGVNTLSFCVDVDYEV